MLDILSLRKDLDAVVAGLEKRKNPQPYLVVASFKAVEAERKTLQTRTEDLQSQRNCLSKQIGQLKAKGPAGATEVDAVMAQVAGLKTELESSAARLDQIQLELQAMLVAVPNLPHESVPVGEDEHGNVVVRTWSPSGQGPAAFDFEIKDHVDLGTPLGLDFEMGVKLTGSRFTVMKGPIARLHRALSQFMLDVQTEEHGYTECYTPYIVNAESLRGTGWAFGLELTDLLAERVALALQLLGANLQGFTLGLQRPESVHIEEGLRAFAGGQTGNGGVEVFTEQGNVKHGVRLKFKTVL